MYKKHFTTTFILLTIFSNLISQQGIQLNTPDSYPSYTLFQNWDQTYLIDNCGVKVADWSEVTSSSYHPKLLPNGNLIHIKDDEIVEHGWDGNIVKTCSAIKELNLDLIYEVTVLPNGNYLALGRRVEFPELFHSLGYNENSGRFTWDDTIVEIDPSTDQLVWEWRISDHVIQERDPNMANYGSIKDNPQLLNVDAISTYDWTNSESFMINGFDYNVELDQIALSVRKISEVIIIDHSTTTEEAKGHTGGKYGKGGDILYRWGNPQNYGQGGPQDRILYFQHNPNWIEQGIHKGSIILFNNGLNRPNTTFDTRYSTVEIFKTDINVDGSYNKTEGQPFLPTYSDFTLSGEEHDFYSGYTCGAEMLPNDNIYINVGGHLLEYDLQGNMVWEYNAPNAGIVFRTEKYAIDYPAFQDNQTSANGSVEFITSSYDCQYFNGSSNEELRESFPNVRLMQTESSVILEVNQHPFKYAIFNSNGVLINQNSNYKSQHIIDTYNYSTGLYIIQVKTDSNVESKKIFIK